MSLSAPGPGSWILDAAHCERPHSRAIAELFPDLYLHGMREGFTRYGILLDTIELRLVDGFAYIAVRPLAAPPDARSLPPRWLFRALVHLHPAVRARVRRAERVLAEQTWREDQEWFLDVYTPRARDQLAALQAEELTALADDALLAHTESVRDLCAAQLREHFRRSAACMVPVGDFLAHACAWTGCQPREALALLTGHSAASVDAVAALDALVHALKTAPQDLEDTAPAALLARPRAAPDPAAPQGLAGADPAALLARLRSAPDPVGPAAHRWLALVEQRIVTGHDPAELRAIEMPEVLVDSLRARLHGAEARVSTPDAGPLRARVPAARQAEFDALLAEARHLHGLRDARCALDYWVLGLWRRALLECGRRLVARGRLAAADHAVDLERAELHAAFAGRGPAADDVAARVASRRRRTCNEMPDHLGPEPAPPLPPEWLPPAAARVARATLTYIQCLHAAAAPDGTRTLTGSPGTAAAPDGTHPLTRTPGATATPDGTRTLTGIAASPGRYTGTARVVTTPDDFHRIARGDVLVARITTPTYSVVLPLLGAVVTERGGVLSHPAIVCREYGIPGVVGARGALDYIPDGARIEVDGGAGTVRVLAGPQEV